MSDDDEPGKVKFGTKELQSGFRGIVVEAKIQKSTKTFGDEPPADQFYWRIQPTSYEADEEHYPMAWYNVKYQKRSKWAALQEHLEKLHCLPKNDDPEDLVGKEFDFERKTLEFGKNRLTNEVMTAENVILPVALIADHKKKTTGGAKSASATPSKLTESEVKEIEKENEIDIEALILEYVKKSPVVVEKMFEDMAKKYKLKRPDVFTAMRSLVKQGLVTLNKEEGILALKE